MASLHHCARFGDIFFNNCIQNGLLPFLFLNRCAPTSVFGGTGRADAVDLTSVWRPCFGSRHGFTVAEHARLALLAGQDDIARTLEHAAEIKAFQSRDRYRGLAYGVCLVQA